MLISRDIFGCCWRALYNFISEEFLSWKVFFFKLTNDDLNIYNGY